VAVETCAIPPFRILTKRVLLHFDNGVNGTLSEWRVFRPEGVNGLSHGMATAGRMRDFRAGRFAKFWNNKVFLPTRQRGSHCVMQKPTGNTTITVPSTASQSCQGS
jgi:predicted RNA binding protein YcfA (HicA-like mRNA interferase family)